MLFKHSELRTFRISKETNIHRLQPKLIGMIVDRGNDFPSDIQNTLEQYGKDMWLFRDDRERCTTRALNIYHGEHRG